ncbi:VOC family protein [Pseudomonas sp. 2FE]|uniref:VOC family protein n=1 Tax=Pseudomonas sp. 2FE TaxID=2502190 RepID=UPI0010F74CB3|nr:VOC family protein [Pseudomonas sp. 2FE]
MSVFAKSTRANLIPCLRYRDAPAAIAWLCRTFGFEEHLLVPDERGGIAHAQLSCGNGMLMLGSADESASAYGRLMRQPDQVGGTTQSLYMVVADADALYARAQAAGAQVVIELKDEDYGGRGFTCRDLEGHVWSFGTYDPWDES